ncbi:MAG: AraC family transcriptional regulator [Bacteroidota bacterium]
MKLVYEDLTLKSSNESFRYFKVEEPQLTPFWHYHPELELTLIYEGNGIRFVGDSILPYQPIDLVLIGENLPHHWVSNTSIEDNFQRAAVVQFPKTLFQSFPECDVFLKLFETAEKGIQFVNPSQDIVKTLIGFDRSPNIKQLSTLMEILFKLTNHTDIQLLSNASYKHQLETQKLQNKIAKTTTYILEHLDQKLTVAHMADYTNLVPQSFCRWFKHAVGNTFITYLNTARIERACQLLVYSNMAIADICFSVGFDSLSHFNRTFLKLKGMSPSRYKATHVV